MELLESCLAGIAKDNPALNAIVALDENRARSAARAAEEAVMCGDRLEPLHGLPIGIKDMTETAGLRTTFGSPLFANHVPARDDSPANGLRAAGAIILAKTNTPEWAAGEITNNPVYGATGNPHAPALTCGGSSGGSAAAPAADLVPLATGSDMGGSLRTPASLCGVVGFRPSPGVVPRSRAHRSWSPHSVEGPMARTVADAGLLLSAMAGFDAGDPLSWDSAPDGFGALPPVDLSTVRAGVSEDLWFATVEEPVRATFRAKLARFAGAFAACYAVDVGFDTAHETFAVLRGVGFVGAHLAKVEATPDKVGPLVTENVLYGRGLDLRQAVEAQADHVRLYRRYQDLFDDIDVLIAPTVAIAAPPARDARTAETIDGRPARSYFEWIALTYGLTLGTGPVVCLPCGRGPGGLPFGIQIAGRRGRDRAVLGIAAALEAPFAQDAELARPAPA